MHFPQVSFHRGVLHVAVAVYVVAMSYLSWVRFVSLQAASFDLGTNIQAVFTAIQGNPTDMPNYVLSWGTLGPSFFAIHFVPIVYLESPILHLFPPALSLFVIQWTLLGLGSEVVYVLARQARLSAWLALGISGLYLLSPPILMGGIYDTHFEAAFPLAALLLYYGLSKSKWSYSCAGFALGALSQESFLLLVPFVAVQVLLDENGGLRAVARRIVASVRSVLVSPRSALIRPMGRWFGWRKGPASPGLLVGIWIAVPVVAFFLELWFLQLVAPHRQALITSNAGYGVSVSHFLLFPTTQFSYWVVTVGLLGFTPLIGLRKAWMAVPALVLSLFSSNIAFSVFAFQYTFLPVAGLFVAAVEGLSILQSRWGANVAETKTSDASGRGGRPAKSSRGQSDLRYRLKRRLGRIARPGPIVVICVAFAVVFSPLLPLTIIYVEPQIISTFVPPSNYQSVENLAKLVPRGASILASDFLFSQVAADSKAVPILKNYTDGRYVLDNYTPPHWQAQYVLIFPADFPSAEDLVPSFPHQFGLRATASISDGEALGTTLIEYALLYERNYTGPVADFAQREVQDFGATDFVTTTGQLVRSPYGQFAWGLYFPALPNATDVVLRGPSTCCVSIDEIPGNYTLTLFVQVDIGPNASSSHVFQVSANSPQGILASWTVNRTSVRNSSLMDINLTLNLTQPVTYFSISISSLEPGYALAFYELEVKPNPL